MSLDYIDPDTFLTGGGIPSAKFPDRAYGTRVGGKLTEKPKVEQQTDLDTGKEKFYADSGEPMMQLVAIVQTDERDPEITGDDGRRKFFCKGLMLAAVRTATRLAKVKGMDKDGELWIEYTADKPSTTRGFNPAKIYTAEYTPPADVAVNEILAEPSAAVASDTWTPPSDMNPVEAAALAAMPDGQRNALLALPPDQRKQFLPSA